MGGEVIGLASIIKLIFQSNISMPTIQILNIIALSTTALNKTAKVRFGANENVNCVLGVGHDAWKKL